VTDHALGRMLNQHFADNAAATEEPRAFPHPPGGRPSEGAGSMAAYRPAVGTAQNATKGSVSTAAPSAVLQPPDRRLSEGVGSVTRGCLRLRECVEQRELRRERQVDRRVRPGHCTN
jgi:hypothetical protein